MNEDTDVRDRLSRMEGKLDMIALQHSTTEATSRDHEERIRGLERWKYALPISALGAVVAGAGTIIAAFKGGA